MCRHTTQDGAGRPPRQTVASINHLGPNTYNLDQNHHPSASRT